MPYSLSIWLDDKTAKALELLCNNDERKRSDMVKVLIRRAAQQLLTEESQRVCVIQALDVSHDSV